MATINDLELGKFQISTLWDVYVDTDVQTEDPLATPEGTVNDLELKKFDPSWKVRVVLTI